jgi:transcriptional regulator with XRE-family HTH domain
MSKAKFLTLPQKLRLCRRQMGMSQREIGKALKLSDKAVSSYEVGRAKPNLETLRLLSALTNRPITYFIEEEQTDAMEIQMRLTTIEKEFEAIRKLLEKVQYPE